MCGTTKTTLHQGHHSDWWSAIYGEIQMRTIVWRESQRDLSRPWPPTPFLSFIFFNHLLTTHFDVDVDKMPEKQSSSIPLRESVRWVGGKAKQTEERSFIWDTQENYISASVSICWGTGGRRHGAGQSELGVRKGAPVDLSLETPPTLLLGSAQLLSSWYNAGGTAAPPPPTTTHNLTTPPTALHVLELRWQPGPQTLAYGGQTKRPALQCAPQLGLCWSGQQSSVTTRSIVKFNLKS